MIELGKHFISNEIYHGDKDYLSSSVVKVGLNGAMSFRHYLDNPKVKKSSAAMDFGTMVHSLVLEPATFDSEYAIYDGETTETGLVPAKVKKELLVKNPAKIIVTKADYVKACKIRKNCELDPKVHDLLFKDIDGENEVSYFTVCPTFGVKIKIRLDRGLINRAIIVDLKTAENVDFYNFQRDVKYVRHYDLSAYMYVMAFLESTGILCDFYWVVAGKSDECPIAVYKAKHTTLFVDGKDKYDRAMKDIVRAVNLKQGERLFYQEQIGEM